MPISSRRRLPVPREAVPIFVVAVAAAGAVAVAATVAAIATACAGPTPTPTATQASDASYVEQGWTTTTRRAFYHVSQGSELMPAAWFVALEDAGAKGRFADRLVDYGFVASDATAAENRGGLPVGFTSAPNDDTAAIYGEREWVGLTCAACHTGEVSLRGRRVRIDGGASLIDFYAFLRGLLAAVDATATDAAKFDRFAQAVRPAQAEALRTNFTKFARDVRARFDRTPEYRANGVTVAGGPGRVDGLGMPINETLCKIAEIGDAALRAQFEEPRNCAVGQPPTSYPQLWGVPHQEFVQWAGNVHNSLARNVGEVNGVFGTNWIEAAAPGVPRYRTSADFRASHAIEGWLADLQAPRWRAMAEAGLVPPLRDDLVRRGGELFAQRCQSCHAVQPELTAPSALGYRYWQVNVTPLKELGTDPHALVVANTRTATLSPLLTKTFSERFKGVPIGPNRTVPVGLYRGLIIGQQLQGNAAAKGISREELAVLSECRDDRSQKAAPGYKGRSLEGVVFTAPYLHNGSVPTLDDLLKPARERPATFVVGCRDYDTERLGYACTPSSERAFLFDTALPGNGNAGHEYGTNLGAADRAALLEFMKGLEPPARPPLPAKGPCGGAAPLTRARS